MTKPNFPALRPDVVEQVRKIEPVTLSGTIVRPCLARLKDGSFHACVYMLDVAEQTDHRWTPGSPSLPPQDVVKVEESHHRLPARFANEIRAAGKSENGYYMFTLDFGWSRKRRHVTGIVDFLAYPMATGPKDVQRVLLHEGDRSLPYSDLPVHWCVFDSAGRQG